MDSTGAIYVGGESVGLPVGPRDYPTTTGSYQTASKSRTDGVISKISPDGTKLIYSTYIGGAQPDAIQGISLAADGSLYFCGTTFSSDFPTTAGVVQRTYGGGISDAFVGHLNASGSSLLYSTFVGGAGQDACAGVVLTPLQHVVAGIYTESSDLRTSTGAAQAQYGGAGDLYFVDLGGEGTALVSATYLGGSGQAAALNADATVNSAANPVAQGSVIVLFGTGLGALQPAPVDGSLIGTPLPMATQKVTATIGGKAATVLYPGGAPSLLAGVIQINLAVPAGVKPGDAEVIITVGEGNDEYPSLSGVTIAVQ